MALKSPMLPSPNGSIISALSPYSQSPTSPARFNDSPVHRPSSLDHPSRLHPLSQSSDHAPSPSDIADPSPVVSSNGTDTTDIDDTAVDHHEEPETASASPVPPKYDTMTTQTQSWSQSPQIDGRGSLHLETMHAAEDALKPRSDEDEQPSSVIHAPQGFEGFHKSSPPAMRRSTPTPSYGSEIVISPPDEDVAATKNTTHNPVSPPFIQTAVAPARDWSATPRAQTRPEIEAQQAPETDATKISSRSSSRSGNLEDIPETELDDGDSISGKDTMFGHAIERLQESQDEVAALKIALSECWTLCNTLAGLSYIHRERIFNFSGKGDRQELAWKSCWKLCQKLYETRDEERASQVRPTLDLCRDFCQCLFEVRQRENDKADSVLRVSFELNNHLYNTHDRTLPEAFRERTLDFYITLCHRLMKQRSELARETSSLLGACWSLAEMLFSLRQNKREGRPADEELLGSAVQACWELCDLFREGWTQVRPDRGTPRPSQTTFTQAFQQAKQTQTTATSSRPVKSGSRGSNSDLAEEEDFDVGRANPETPTTVFEDTQQMSPDDAPQPNILVLGPPDQINHQGGTSQRHPHHLQWSSSSSTLSGFSQNSRTTTSSNSTIINPAAEEEEDPHLTCLKLLIIKAALNVGYQRPLSPSTSSRSPPSSSSRIKHPDSSSGSTRSHSNSNSSNSKKSSRARISLASFVKALPSNSFGSAPWQLSLLDSYKKLVASEPSFAIVGGSTTNDGNGCSSNSNNKNGGSILAGPVRRARASDVARSVAWMVEGGPAGRYGWLRDLYRLVFGFRIEEGQRRGDVVIQS